MAKAYQIIDNTMHNSFVIGPLFHCLSKAEGKELLFEIHVGICGEQIGYRALATKVFRQGFYWLSVVDDT
jgi:hypothetical protein